MVVNKFKLLAASSLAVVGLAGAGAIHMASAQTPAPAVTSAVQAPVSSTNDAETNDSPTGATDGGNTQQGDQSAPDTSSATDKKD